MIKDLGVGIWLTNATSVWGQKRCYEIGDHWVFEEYDFETQDICLIHMSGERERFCWRDVDRYFDSYELPSSNT